jgi:hypothetical protein
VVFAKRQVADIESAFGIGRQRGEQAERQYGETQIHPGLRQTRKPDVRR